MTQDRLQVTKRKMTAKIINKSLFAQLNEKRFSFLIDIISL